MTLKITHKEKIDAILAKYDDRRSAVLPTLYIAQDEYGYLSDEAIQDVADALDFPATDIFEVVGFYTLYYRQPVGKWVIQVCDDVPCCYCGAEPLIAKFKEVLGINEEETTEDGMFTLQRVKCLAACHRAPVVQTNLAYMYSVQPEQVDGLIRELRKRADSDDMWQLSGCDAEDYELSPDGLLRLIERNMGDIPKKTVV